MDKILVLGGAAGKLAGVHHHGAVVGDGPFVVLLFMLEKLIVREVVMDLADTFQSEVLGAEVWHL